jgi:hypothetical protein
MHSCSPRHEVWIKVTITLHASVIGDSSLADVLLPNWMISAPRRAGERIRCLGVREVFWVLITFPSTNRYCPLSTPLESKWSLLKTRLVPFEVTILSQTVTASINFPCPTTQI